MRLRIAIVIPAFALATACVLEVEDQTPAPPQYSGTAPAGFPVKAKVHKEGLMTTPTITTVVLRGTPATYQWNVTVPMTRDPADAEKFSGTLPVAYPTDVRPLTACGFTVTHTAKSTFMGIIPQQKVVSKQVAGNSYAAYVGVNGTTASFPSGGGGTINTGELSVNTYSSTWVIALFNGYMSGLTLNKVALTCDNGQACSAVSPPYIGNIQLPTVPMNLACGDFAGVFFVCDEPAWNQKGGDVTFETSLGTVLVPFKCGPEFGA